MATRTKTRTSTVPIDHIWTSHGLFPESSLSTAYQELIKRHLGIGVIIGGEFEKRKSCGVVSCLELRAKDMSSGFVFVGRPYSSGRDAENYEEGVQLAQRHHTEEGNIIIAYKNDYLEKLAGFMWAKVGED